MFTGKRLHMMLAVLCLLLSSSASGADWPCYRGNSARTGVTIDGFKFPLTPAWVYKPAQPPRPAWPDAYRKTHRVDFDYAPQPIIARDKVYFGSSTDDTLRALDARTGALKWRYTTGGPIRFAPAVYRDNVYVASDDGLLHCLNADTGKLKWLFRPSANARRVVGNGRLIARAPLRSGVLVDNGVAYVTAGMWPSEGTRVCAVDAETGKQIWLNDTAGSAYIAQPHFNAYAITGVAPQGHLAASKNILLVPTGRAVPAAFDRRTGRLLYYRNAINKRLGGVWTVIDEKRGQFFNGHLNRVSQYSLNDGKLLGTFKRDNRLLVADEGYYRHSSTSLLGPKSKWKVPYKGASLCMAMAGDAFIVGGSGKIMAYARSSGKAIWSSTVNGEVRGIAASDGRLIVSTDLGTIHSFERKRGRSAATVRIVDGKPARAGGPTSESFKSAAAITKIIATHRITKGYALLTGQRDARLGEAVVKGTGLNVICILPDAKTTQAERNRLLDTTTHYGSRITVYDRADLRTGALPPYFANFIVAPDGARLTGDDLARVLRPCGGVLAVSGTQPTHVTDLLKKAGVPEVIVRAQGDWTIAVRGKLPNAFDWDSTVKRDHRVRWPLELLWFGGPGPGRMGSRRWRSGPPVVAEGRYYTVGRDSIIAVDAYNGVELWSRRVPGAHTGQNRGAVSSLAADATFVYANMGQMCLKLDAQTGRLAGVYGTLKNVKDIIPDLGAIKTRPLTELPPIARKAGRQPQTPARAESVTKRLNPLTGQTAPLTVRKAYGCGGRAYSESMVFFRSGTIGFYDFADDSGVRNFGGVRPSCGDPGSLVPALGIVVSTTGDSECACAYNFQTSLALVPTSRRSNEDWAVFYQSVDVGSILAKTALNLGAPGDRRDDARQLWMSYPRPRAASRLSLSMAIPLHINVAPGGGGYRINGDRVSFTGTDKPWLYASGYRGLTRASFDLTLYDERHHAVTRPTAQAPVIDGKLDDACWDGLSQMEIADNDVSVYARVDKENLYMAFQKNAAIDRRGNVAPWTSNVKAKDGPVWQDDAFEVSFGSKTNARILHLGLSSTGASYDALWANRFDIPRLKNITIDGKTDDWAAGGLQVTMVKNYGTCRLGWTRDGLVMLIKHKKLGKKRHGYGGFVAVAAQPGQRDYLQVSADFRNQTAETWRQSRKGPADREIDMATTKKGESLIIEALFRWKDLGIQPKVGAQIAFPIFYYKIGEATPRLAASRKPNLQDYMLEKPEVLIHLRLAEKPGRPVTLGMRNAYSGRLYGIFYVRENPSWDGNWKRAIQAGDKALTAEMAIPWTMLQEVGIGREKLRINLRDTGLINENPWVLLRDFWPRSHVVTSVDRKTTPRRYTVRLHFAEPDEVGPGERVFDIYLQGKVVKSGFDPVKAAGARNKAVVLKFDNVMANKTLTLELRPRAKTFSPTTAPIISAIDFQTK
jgi:outer membrane protein assembly factor BamB